MFILDKVQLNFHYKSTLFVFFHQIEKRRRREHHYSLIWTMMQLVCCSPRLFLRKLGVFEVLL